MDEFRILSKSGSDIALVPGLPDESTHSRLPLSEAINARSNFGTLSFPQSKGDNWSVWQSNYLIRESEEIYGLADLEIIELHCAWKNSFPYHWEGFGEAGFKNMGKPLEFNLSYSPYVKTSGWLAGGQDYHTMDFYLSREILENYAEAYLSEGSFTPALSATSFIYHERL
jgi:hypothetical protein